MTRSEFNTLIRRLSVQDPGDQQYHCRVEICIKDDWRVLTDSCRFEDNIPLVLAALADMLWIYVLEHYPDVPAAECRRLGKPAVEGVDRGMRLWPAPVEVSDAR